MFFECIIDLNVNGCKHLFNESLCEKTYDINFMINYNNSLHMQVLTMNKSIRFILTRNEYDNVKLMFEWLYDNNYLSVECSDQIWHCVISDEYLTPAIIYNLQYLLKSNKIVIPSDLSSSIYCYLSKFISRHKKYKTMIDAWFP